MVKYGSGSDKKKLVIRLASQVKQCQFKDKVDKKDDTHLEELLFLGRGSSFLEFRIYSFKFKSFKPLIVKEKRERERKKNKS